MDSINALNSQLEVLTTDISQIEKVLIDQIDGLAKAIPEIYAGYASLIRTMVNSAMQVIKPSDKTATSVALALEVGTRSIQAYGEYKAAKEHNRLLSKYMMVKETIARNNIEKVSNLLPKASATAKSSGRLFKKLSELSYNLDDLNDAQMSRIAAIQIKGLTMYRTNIYLLELCKYLKNEYSVWLSGHQRSEFDIPDYYLINQYIAAELFGDDLLQAYSDAVDEYDCLTGKQIMLISDYQMSFMALGEKLCEINILGARPILARLLLECGAAQDYEKITKPYRKQIKKNPKVIITLLGILSAIVVVWILGGYFEGSEAARGVIGLASFAAILRICIKGNKNAKIQNVEQAFALQESTNQEIQTICGKMERPDIDYNERNILKSTIAGFFN